MAINPLSTVSAIGGAMQTIYNKAKEQSVTGKPENEFYGSGGSGTNTGLPLKSDGSPAWIGGAGNANYNPIAQGASGGWYNAEKARLRAIDRAAKRQKAEAKRQYQLGQSFLAGQAATERRRLNEYLAQTGRLGAGAGLQAQLSTQGQLMSGLGTLEATNLQTLAEIERQQDEARAQLLAEQAQRQQALQEQAFERDVAGIQAGAYNQDIQAEINRRTAINPNDLTIPILQAQRNQKLAGIAESQAEAEETAFNRWYKEQQLALQRARLGGGGGDGGNTGYEPNLTAAQAKSAFESGLRTPEVLEAYDFYYGTSESTIGLNELNAQLSMLRSQTARVNAIENYFNQGIISEEQARLLIDRYRL